MSTTQQIAKYGNVDDLLFRGKNKAYGAYALRREYDERLKKSMFFFLMLCSGIVLSFIIYNQIKPKVDTSTTIYCPMGGETTLIKVEQTKFPKEIPLKNDVKQNALVPPKIVDKVDEKVELKPIETIIKDNGIISSVDKDGVVPTQITDKPVETTGIIGNPTGNVNTEIYTDPDVMPMFPGGEAGLMRFIQSNVEYPSFEKENGISGTILVTFVVNEDGSTKLVRIEGSEISGFKSQAMKMLKLMPNWIPGSQAGQKVRAYMSVPLTFKPEDNEN